VTRPPDERLLVCEELNSAIDALLGNGGRLDVIYPADQPHTAIMRHNGQLVRLTTCPEAPPPGDLGEFRPEFLLTTAGASPGEGRAGMLYRDLIPSRLGGRYIASHITIPNGGPVADWVHFHRIAFQLIVVRSGWVRVVYEDQGDPFVMLPGDLVVQPPTIRHQVLESSDGLEVIEIGSPALHETVADHELELPTGRVDPQRDFGGQRFLRHVAADKPWTEFDGSEAQETQVAEVTKGAVTARMLRPASARIAIPPCDGELVFGFVMAGGARLDCCGDHTIGPADAFVVPPGEAWSLDRMSPDFQLLHVTGGGAAKSG
jgi:quercetin dioxygenase-like cupin family protein